MKRLTNWIWLHREALHGLVGPKFCFTWNKWRLRSVEILWNFRTLRLQRAILGPIVTNESETLRESDFNQARCSTWNGCDTERFRQAGGFRQPTTLAAARWALVFHVKHRRSTLPVEVRRLATSRLGVTAVPRGTSGDFGKIERRRKVNQGLATISETFGRAHWSK